MYPLILHPDCAPGPIKAVSALVEPTVGGCKARFRLDGDIAAIKVPAAGPSIRTDYLWKTTCFEIFWQPHRLDSYREFNLSPSGRWACYDFDGFRLNSRDALVDAISISCSYNSGQLELVAELDSTLPVPANVALNAIVEDHEGNIQFWALAFAPGKPEFHSEICRQLHIAGRLRK